MRARDIMTRPVHTVGADDPIEQVAALLAEKEITAAPVVDATGTMIGIVSEGDLLWHHVPADLTAHLWRAADGDAPRRPRTVREVMVRKVISTPGYVDVADVAQAMVEHDVRSVPVIDDGALVGIVSRRDILRTMVRTDDMICREVQHRLDAYAGDHRRWTAAAEHGDVTITGAFDDDVERQVITVLARTVPGVFSARVA